VDGCGKGVVAECGVAEAVVAADESAQLEAVQIEGMQAVLVVALVIQRVLMLSACKDLSLLISQKAFLPNQVSQ